MSTRITVRLAACGLILACVGQGAFALEDIPTTSGFSGKLGLGAGYTDAETNLVKGNSLVEIGQSSVSSSFRAPKGEDDAFVYPSGQFAYTFGSQQIQLFLASDIEELVDLETLTQLGVRKQFQRLGIVSLGYVSSGVLAQEVWSDPYDSTRSRSDTDRTFGGVRFEWDRIAGLPIGVLLQYKDVEIDDEFSGTANLGANNPSRSLLSREGDVYRGEFRYTWRRAANQFFTPFVGYEDADLDGEAMAYTGPYVGINVGYQGAVWGVGSRARVGSREMSKRNPIYGRRTDSDWFEIALSTTYKLPWDNWVAKGTVAYAEDNNDVRFHDQQNLLFLIGAEWRFGQK